MGNIKKSIIVSLILIGITAISAQIILIRELLTVFYGNEISIGFILAVWLVSGAIGSGVFGRMLSRICKDKVLMFVNLQILAGLLIPVSVVFSRIIGLLFGATPGEILAIPVLLLWSAIILGPLCVVLGILFVLGCNIYVASDAAKKIGSTYILEAIGSTVGGVITSLILIRILNSIQIAAILSLCNLAACLFVVRALGVNAHEIWKRTVRTCSLLLIILLLLFSAAGGLGWAQRKTMAMKWRGLDLLDVRNSVYGRNVVTGEAEQFSFFTNSLHMFTAPDALTSEETVHFPMLSHPDPQNILLIGGGVSEVTEEILKYPIKKLDYVELDPQIVLLAKTYLKGEPYYRLGDKRVSVINEDARFFIKNTKGRYDVCIINLPNPYTAQINRFYTVEFFKSLERILNPGAVVSFSVSSSENYISREQARFLASLLATARSVFRDVKIVPGDTAHFLLSGKKGRISRDCKNFVNQLKRRKIDTLFVNEYYLFSKLSAGRIKYLDDSISKVKFPELNLDFRPISFYYDMILWSTYFSSDFFRLFELIDRRFIIYASSSVFLLIIVLSFLLRGKRGARRRLVLLALGTTGFSEISFQMFIILAFQIIYGYLYYRLGMIITSFMIGLSLGSIFIVKRLDSIRDRYKTYIKVQGLVCLYPLVLLAIFLFLSKYERVSGLWVSSNVIFASLPFIAGFVGGVQFPLANKICLESGPDIGHTAGITYAVDLFGACVGALLISVFVVPIIGITGACVLVCLLNLVTLFALAINR